MSRPFRVFTGLLVFALGVTSLEGILGEENWPQFRGPQASGITSGNPPVSWDIETGKNIRWTTDVPGLGHSSPVVWDDRIFLTTAVNSESDRPSLQTGWLGGTGKAAGDEGDWTWQVICLNRTDGKILWTKDVTSGKPAIKRHLKASHANCTCATNGNYVVAFFGSEGLYCLDFNGELIWNKDFGKLHSGPYNAPKLEWGFSSSPIIFDGKVIVQCDCLNTAFVSVLDLKTGNEIRRIERQDVATWSTPAVVKTDDQTQIVCNGYRQMAGYDLETGELLWELSGGGDVPVPTPLYFDGKIILTNGHARSPTYVIRPDARGNLTPDPEADDNPDGLIWWHPRDGSYMPTPIAVNQRLFTFDDNGKLTVRNVTDGEKVHQRRFGKGTFSASAVGTSNQIYVSSEPGKVFVVKTSGEFELLATNDLKQNIMATPAIAGDELLIRTTTQLVCIANDEEGKP